MKLTKNFLRNLIRESLVRDFFVPSSEEDKSKLFITDEDGGTYVLNVDKWDSLKTKLIALHKQNPKKLFAYLRDFAESPSFGYFLNLESGDLIDIANRMDFKSLLAIFDKEAKDVKANRAEKDNTSSFGDIAKKVASDYSSKQAAAAGADSDAALAGMAKLEENRTRIKVKVK